MTKDKEIYERIGHYWWIAVIIVVMIILFSIPAKVGLPEDDYRGCERKTSICITSDVKAIDRGSEGSMAITVTVPAELNDGEETDVAFKLNEFDNAISVGNTIVMDFNQDENEASLFIEKDTSLLWKLVTGFLWYGPTAVIDVDTFEEIDRE